MVLDMNRHYSPESLIRVLDPIRGDQCDLAVAYLRDETAEPAFGYYYERDLVAGRPAGVPIHCVAVTGDPETGMLLSTAALQTSCSLGAKHRTWP